VRANGWLLFDQGKMSKSRGNIVRAETVQEVLGADALRYFLLREIPFGQDGSFSFDALVQRYNADLANGYGNLVSRVVNMVHKYFGGVMPEAGAETAAEAALRESAVRTIAAFGPEFDALNFSEALKSLWLLVAETDGYLTANAPWKKPADRSEGEHATVAGAGAGDGGRGDSYYYGAGLSDFAGVGGEGVAAAWAGRDCGRGKEIIFD
jgi:methionyl-tRNA synthetase